jgi:5-methylcytosine-specific restriction endonuclease McrA
MKNEILKLNAIYAPISITDWQSAMTIMVKGNAFPVDISYEIEENGCINKNKIEWFNVVRSFDDWKDLPIRDWDDYVRSANAVYRLPSIIVCANFKEIVHKKILFPTKSNIWARDNYTCQYTGKKLTRNELTVDHILPSSRGGDNSWENLVTCDKELNIWKSDRTPKECGLKLLSKPARPKNGLQFNFIRDEWKMFLENGDFN